MPACRQGHRTERRSASDSDTATTSATSPTPVHEYNRRTFADEAVADLYPVDLELSRPHATSVAAVFAQRRAIVSTWPSTPGRTTVMRSPGSQTRARQQS